MTVSDLYTLNSAVDARPWARTAKAPREAGRSAEESVVAVQDEQRYNQTSTESGADVGHQKAAAETSTSSRLVGNQITFFVDTMRDVRRARAGLPPLRDHSQSPPLFGSQVHFFAGTFSRVLRRDR